MATAELSPKSRFAAAVLCWLGGGFGLHRFYLGRKKSAIAMLIVGIISALTVVVGVGLVGIAVILGWAFIDFIMILAGVMKDGQGRRVGVWFSSS